MSTAGDPVPPNEIVKVFGDFRIIKTYYRYSVKPFELIECYELERRRINLGGEVYYSIAIDDPDKHSRPTEQVRAYEMLAEFRQLIPDLLKELAK